MKEEDKLLKKVGTENPFTVPEGYFEHLTSEVMNNLPERQVSPFVAKESTLWDRVKPWTYMAAMFVGAALIVRIASNNPNPLENNTIAATEVEAEMAYDEYIDQLLNHSLLDDYSLYMYLSDASID